MICKPENIRLVRPIAKNIAEYERIAPYIEEAERLDVMPVIGVNLYRQLDEAVTENDLTTLINDASENVILNPDNWRDMLCGAYFTDCGCEKWHPGLIKTISFLAYARCLVQHQINVTAFGVVFKESQFSERVDDKTLIRAANKAESIGKEYLRQVRDFLRYLCLLDCCVKPIRRRKKIEVIGF